MRFNADLNLSKRLTAIANLSFTYNEQNLKDQGASRKTNPLFLALIKSPFISVNEVSNTGIESPSLTDSDTFNISNPVAIINGMKGTNKNYRFFGSIGFNYTLSKTISLSTTTNVTVDKVRENISSPVKVWLMILWLMALLLTVASVHRLKESLAFITTAVFLTITPLIIFTRFLQGRVSVTCKVE